MSESFSFDAKSAGIWRFIPAGSFALILIAGFAVTTCSLREVPAAKWAEMAHLKPILQGESTRRFTSQLNEHFLWSKPFARIERAVNWKIAGDTGPSVRTGCEGWFFLSEELTTFDGGSQNANARAYMVGQVAQLLEKKNIRLVVAVTPDKSRIEQEHLCGLHRPAGFTQRAQDWMSTVRSRQVDVIDLSVPLTAFRGERYYRTDSHWNEAGANAAAAAIAAHLAQLQLVDKPAHGIPADAVKTSIAERMGDLFRVSNLEGLPEWWRPAIEKTATSVVAPVVSQSDDLFGDTGLPAVALIGTSFSLRGNFVPMLSQHLGAPVANLAKDGGDFDGSATAYLHGKTFQQEPPKVVVWEIPERMLQKPFKPSERVWLEDLKQGRL
ncbi:alginate O-acetyltransferase AlgX-related protein [Undibacterium griseum]|uniref:Cell division protein FtsQ n=1 Tax=Undibacterium griseum TaxID=2762295 RepID=A0ABR6YKP7_9BURK|nr:cell division protein FtsQ [Undibacterium griseum]MBC3884463.1 cell division protein FtsQ [Undibacterium griseum]